MNNLVIAALAQSPPLLAGLTARGRSNGGRRWMIAWAAFSMLGQFAQAVVESRHGSTEWMGRWLPPIDGTLTMLALACWQDLPILRTIYRGAAAAALLAHAIAIVVFHSPHGLLLLGAPAFGVLGVAAALYTFVDRSLRTNDRLTRQDWFWVSGCLTFYSAIWSVLPPLLRWARVSAPDIYLDGRSIFLLFGIIAPAVVTVGLLCPAAARDARVTRQAAYGA